MQQQAAQQQAFLLQLQANQQKPLNLTVKNAEDEARESAAKLHLVMLRLFFATGKLNMETGKVTDVALPEWSVAMKEIIANSTVSARNLHVQNMLHTAFQPKDEEKVTRQESVDPMNTRLNMSVFTKSFVTALMSCNFSTEGIVSTEVESMNMLTYLHFLGQNSETKVE